MKILLRSKHVEGKIINSDFPKHFQILFNSFIMVKSRLMVDWPGLQKLIYSWIRNFRDPSKDIRIYF